MFERPLLDIGVPVGAKNPVFGCSDPLVVPQNTGVRSVCGLWGLYLKAGSLGWRPRPGQAELGEGAESRLCTSGVTGRRKEK